LALRRLSGPFSTVFGLLGRLARTKAGAAAGEAIVSGLRGGVGKLRNVLGSARDLIKRIISRGGAAGGAAAAENVASDLAGGMSAKTGRIRNLFRNLFKRVGVTGGSAAASSAAGALAGDGAAAGLGGAMSGRLGRFKAIFSRFGGIFGRVLGGALLTAASAYLATHFHDTIGNTFGKIVLPFAPRGGNPGRDPHPDHHTPPGYHLEPAGGGRFWEVPNRTSHPRAGHPGKHRTRAHPNRRIEAGGNVYMENHFHVANSSPGHVGDRWHVQVADQLRRRGQAFVAP
jgi:hypothetical protein